jgi:hypothetical protein
VSLGPRTNGGWVVERNLPTDCGRPTQGARVERRQHDSQNDRSTTRPPPPEQHRPEVPTAESVPLDVMPPRELSPDIVFTSLGERRECVWVSHENIVRPV